MHDRSNRMRLTLSLAGLLAALLLLGRAMGESEQEPEAGDFEGPAACGDCHPDVHDAWSRSTHARTLLPAVPGNLPPILARGGRILHPPGESRIRVGEDGIFAETVGPGGDVEAFPVDAVLGARRVRMFLTTLPDGRRQVLPFMLDEPNERFFDYSDLVFGGGGGPDTAPTIRPGEPSFWTGYPRFFDARCARCHTVGWEFTGLTAGDGEPKSRWDHDGVGCEGCHGPAAEHAAYWNDEIVRPGDPILPAGELANRAGNDLCLSCHTEALAVADFSPGDDFFESFDPTLLDDTERFDPAGRSIELTYDGIPFSASLCVEKGGLTCLTCHDPHGTPYRGQLVAPPGSDALCADCHGEIAADPAAHSRHDPERFGGRCTDCHMPLLTVERGHGAITDHTIGVPNPDFAGPGIARDACTWCHTGARGAPGGVPRLTPDEILDGYREWWPGAAVRPAWAVVLDRARRGDAAVFPELADLARDADANRVARASAAALLGRFPDRAPAVLEELARDADSLVRRRVADSLGGIRSDSADSLLLGLLLDRSPAVRLRAARAALRGWRRISESTELVEPVLVTLRERTEAFPEDDAAWFLLGALHQIRGDVPAAIEAYEKKLALDPYARLVRETVEELKRR